MKLSTATALACLGLLSFGCDKLDTGGGGDGDKVNFTSGYVFVRSRNIFVADSSDYGAARQLTTSSDCSWPTVSADGRVVVYVRGGTSLRKINPDGTSDGLLADGAGAQLSQPAVSPDASLVAYVSASGSQSSIHLVNIDGSDDRAVPQSTHDASPSFYPDGSYLAVLSGPDALSLNEVDKLELTSGQRAVRLTPAGNTYSRLALSPDGARVALEVKSGSRTHVFVADEAQGDPQMLADTKASERSPTWVDSGTVGFVSDAGGIPTIYESEVGAGTDAFSPKLADADQCMFGGR